MRAQFLTLIQSLINLASYSDEFKGNEAKTVKDIDTLAKEGRKGKDKGGMKEAADSAEEIRKWVSITFGRLNLLNDHEHGSHGSLEAFGGHESDLASTWSRSRQFYLEQYIWLV